MTHEELFESYVEELSQARDAVRAWWKELKQRSGGGEGERQLQSRWPYGPFSHPRIVGVIRKYFLACEELNASVDDDDEVSPEVFLGEWLLDDHEELTEALSGLVYYPIGMNADGDYQ